MRLCMACTRTNHVPKELCVHTVLESGFLGGSRSKTPFFRVSKRVSKAWFETALRSHGLKSGFPLSNQERAESRSETSSERDSSPCEHSLDALSCYLSIIFKHSDKKKGIKKNSRSIFFFGGGGGRLMRPCGSATVLREDLIGSCRSVLVVPRRTYQLYWTPVILSNIQRELFLPLIQNNVLCCPWDSTCFSSNINVIRLVLSWFVKNMWRRKAVLNLFLILTDNSANFYYANFEEIS